MREVAEPRAAPLFLDGDTEKSERAELRPQFAGKLFDRSISSARGAILSWAKPRMLSRNISTSLPRPKSRPGRLFESMARSCRVERDERMSR